MQFIKDPKLILPFVLSFTIVFAFFSSAIAFAQTDTIQTVDEAMQQIMSSQNVSNANQVDCSKVTDSQFENLGDAVMERMIGNHQLHEQMDAIMGGEGSQSLTNMHIYMGRNWLGCTANFQGRIGPEMMGGFGGMMGGASFNGYMGNMMMNMMGYYYPAYYSTYNNLFMWTIVGWVFFVVMLAISILLWTGRIAIPKKKK